MISRIISWLKKIWNPPASFVLERDHPDCPDLVYTFDEPDYNGRCDYAIYEERPVRIIYSLPNMYKNYNLSEEDETFEFLVWYQLLELEEFTHAMGEFSDDEKHSPKWMQFLAENVVSPTSDEYSVELYFVED